ncbi:hypothetical protein AgCh_019327 [Apium graveolens]
MTITCLETHVRNLLLDPLHEFVLKLEETNKTIKELEAEIKQLREAKDTSTNKLYSLFEKGRGDLVGNDLDQNLLDGTLWYGFNVEEGVGDLGGGAGGAANLAQLNKQHRQHAKGREDLVGNDFDPNLLDGTFWDAFNLEEGAGDLGGGAGNLGEGVGDLGGGAGNLGRGAGDLGGGAGNLGGGAGDLLEVELVILEAGQVLLEVGELVDVGEPDGSAREEVI